MYKTILKEATFEEEIKKSRFIGYISPVLTKEEAEEFILSIKEKHKDARHNCSAYIIGEDALIQKYDDDGEPSKTAGPPILEVLKNLELRNVVCVVTRYFGGVLLGAGGLIRAYSSACAGAAQEAKIVEMHPCKEIEIEYDYLHHGSLEYYFLSNGFPIIESNFGEKVSIKTLVLMDNEGKFFDTINGITSATHTVKYNEKTEIPLWNGELLVEGKTYKQ